MPYFKSPVLFIGNSYRKQLLIPLMRSNLFGKRISLYIDSGRLFKRSPVRNSFYKLLIKIAGALVISDEESAKIFDCFKIEKSKKILWFCWNGADEMGTWPLTKAKFFLNLKLCFLFSDESLKFKKNYELGAAHLKYPILKRATRRYPKRYLISYVGEVDIVEELKTVDKKISDYIWELTERFTVKGGFTNSGFANSLTQVDKSPLSSDKISPSYFLWVLRNRIRFTFIKAVKEKYGADFVLVGNDWGKYKIDALASDYNQDTRYKLYADSKICLDLLSKSSPDAQYPRSSEIISYSDGLFQLKTADSIDLFGDQTEMRTFASLSELNSKLETLLKVDDQEFAHLGKLLREQSLTKTQAHNLVQI